MEESWSTSEFSQNGRNARRELVQKIAIYLLDQRVLRSKIGQM